MTFTFTPDQRAFAEALGDVLEKSCTTAVVREAWAAHAIASAPDPDLDAGDAPRPIAVTDRVDALWRELAAVGLLGIVIAEGHGGMGMDAVDAVLLLEQLGRHAVPLPVAESAFVAGPLIAEAADQEVADFWLPQIASGAVKALVVHPGQELVAFADTADLFLFVATSDDGVDQLHGATRHQVRAILQPSLDPARPISHVTLEPTADSVLGEGSHVAGAMLAAFDRDALAAAAQQLGAGRRMIDLAVEHALQRQQFGKPIGAFQAVKHHLADALVGVEFARPTVAAAAVAIAAGDVAERERDVSVAAVFADEASCAAAKHCLQVLGGIGYTWEHDLQLFMKRVWTLRHVGGDVTNHRARLARLVLVDRTA